MAENLYVRKHCNDCNEDLRDVQLDTPNEAWVPEGHEGHDLGELHIERVEVV